METACAGPSSRSVRQRGAAWARFALALVTLAACRAAEPISVEQRWLKAVGDENTPSGDWLYLGGSQPWFSQWSLFAPWESQSELFLLTSELDLSTGTRVESWIGFDVGRRFVDRSATRPNDIFVVSDAGAGESVIDRFRVTLPAGGHRVVPERGGSTKYELAGDRVLPPDERDKATIERFEIARIEGPVVAIAAEPNARSLLAFVRREQGPSKVLQVDVASGSVEVLADSARFPELNNLGEVFAWGHGHDGFVVASMLNGGRYYVPWSIVVFDRDRDGDFDDVQLLDDYKFEASGRLDDLRRLDD
jgi:hypothetical protein